jgi:methionine synthase II (cobalamin-independent)
LDEAYGDEEALAIDVASALNLELLDLQAAGCDVVQIDEPAMTRYHKKVTAYGLALSTVASKAFTYRLSCISATDIPAAASMSMNTPSSWRS